MAKLQVQIVTPQATVLEHLELDSLTCPTSTGYITILPGHVPRVSNLLSGELIARGKDGEHNIHVAGGFVQVQGNNKIIILADAAEHAHEINEQQAEEAIKRAQETLAQTKFSDEEYATAAASLERSLSRLNFVRKHAHRRTAPITGQGVLKE